MNWYTSTTSSNNWVVYNFNGTSNTWVSTGGYVSYQELVDKIPTTEQKRLEKLRQIQANHGKVHKIIIV